MPNTSFADCSKLILPDLDQLARQTQLVQRQSYKFTPHGFLCSLLQSVTTGMGSLNQIAGQLHERTGFAMARQSLHERFSKKSTAFLLKTLGELMEQRYKPATEGLIGGQIRRLVIEDSSSLRLPKSNAKHFPAHGNDCGETAGVKIDFTYDLLTGNMITHTLELATTQDKSIGKETLIETQSGDLFLRDMGYFCLSEFCEIEKRNAYWLTRLPLTTNVFFNNGKDLEKLLRNPKSDLLDLDVEVGNEYKNCRLIAVRASEEVTRKRRRERRKKAKEQGKKTCAKALIRDGWHIMLTNLTTQQASASQLTKLYAARWAVEIQFRAWKQSLNLAKALNRKSQEHHLQALVLAGMIAHQLGMKIGGLLVGQMGFDRLSFEKLYDILSSQLLNLTKLTDACDFSPNLRHITRDKRKRKSPVVSAIIALT